MKNKKSAIEVQFNWLFVLIVGAVILIAFFGFSVKQKNVSRDITSSSLVNSLDVIITSAQSSAGEVSNVPIPKEEITFECNRISVGTAGRQYENLIMFSPRELKSSKLLTHTASLNIPYRVANLLFVTSPDVRYILIGDFDDITGLGEFARFVDESIPVELTKDTFDSDAPSPDPDVPYASDANLDNEKHSKVRFVIIDMDTTTGGVPTDFQDMDNEDVSKVVINEITESVEFFQKNGDAWVSKGSSKYIGESLIGAIYSDDIGQYVCSMENVFDNVKKVTEVYKGRVVVLAAAANPLCKSSYDSAYDPDPSPSGALEIISNSDFPLGVGSINGQFTTLESANDDLQIRSCPLVY